MVPQILFLGFLLAPIACYEDFGTYGNPSLTPWMNLGNPKQSPKFHNLPVASERFPCSRAVSRWTRKELQGWVNIQADNLHYQWPENCPWNPRNDPYLLQERQKKFESPYFVHIPSKKTFKKEYYLDLYLDKVALNSTLANIREPSCLADYCLVFDSCSPPPQSSIQSSARYNQRCDVDELNKAKSMCESAIDRCFPVSSVAKFLNIEARRRYCETLTCEQFKQRREVEYNSGSNLMFFLLFFLAIILAIIFAFMCGSRKVFGSNTGNQSNNKLTRNIKNGFSNKGDQTTVQDDAQEEDRTTREYQFASNYNGNTNLIRRNNQRKNSGGEMFASYASAQRSPAAEKSPGSGITFRELMERRQKASTGGDASPGVSSLAGDLNDDRSPFLPSRENGAGVNAFGMSLSQPSGYLLRPSSSSSAVGGGKLSQPYQQYQPLQQMSYADDHYSDEVEQEHDEDSHENEDDEHAHLNERQYHRNRVHHPQQEDSQSDEDSPEDDEDGIESEDDEEAYAQFSEEDD
eukprot:GDKK01061613.1.p1 GENE.GDKK01061613.1~~GDKK01061613.1.p1  ORF type:complete len:519 (+),score=76.92 GDKK01061613.1:25-1581(+)